MLGRTQVSPVGTPRKLGENQLTASTFVGSATYAGSESTLGGTLRSPLPTTHETLSKAAAGDLSAEFIALPPVDWSGGMMVDICVVKLTDPAGNTGLGTAYCRADIAETVWLGRENASLNNMFLSERDESCALSGIDIAKWDLRANREEKPLQDLLHEEFSKIGGGFISKLDAVKAYITIPLAFYPDDAERQRKENEDRLNAAKARGFQALKIYAPKPFAYASAGAHGQLVEEIVEKELALLREARAIVGPDFELMFDCMGFQPDWKHSSEWVTRIHEVLEECEYRWMEEPIAQVLDAESYLALTQTELLDVRGCRIAGGESVYGGVEKMLPWLDSVHILQPDVAVCGGLSVFIALQKAILTEGRSVELTPHGFSSVIGTLCDLHFKSLCFGTETCPPMIELSEHVIEQCPALLKLDAQGCVKVPCHVDGLGLHMRDGKFVPKKLRARFWNAAQPHLPPDALHVTPAASLKPFLKADGKGGWTFYEPGTGEIPAPEVRELRERMRLMYEKMGAVVVRGDHHGLRGASELLAIRELLKEEVGGQLGDYVGGSNAREKASNENPDDPLLANVYDTGAPGEADLHFHNELNYRAESPQVMTFMSLASPTDETVGATFLSDNLRASEEILRSDLGRRICEDEVIYVRKLPDQAFVAGTENEKFVFNTWQQSFQTQSPEEAEQKARDLGYEVSWEMSDRFGRYMVTRMGCDGMEQYKEGNHLYCSLANDAPWFDSWPGIEELADEERPTLLELGDRQRMSLREQRQWVTTLDKFGVPIFWREGDVAILDNVRWMHGRPSYSLPEGEKRKLGVVIGEPFRRQGRHSATLERILEEA